MGQVKQRAIVDPYDNPFTPEELERFEAEEKMQREDEANMRQEYEDNRAQLIDSLLIVQKNLASWEETRKFRSSLIDDSRERVATAINTLMERKV